MTCARYATREELDTDPEAFADCETGECELCQREAGLSEDDRLALAVYGLLGLSVVRDFKLQPLVFEVLGLTMTRRRALDLVYRLDAAHQARLALAQDEETGAARAVQEHVDG